MAEKGKNGNRDYKKEYAEYHSKPEKVAERSQRNKARRKLAKEGVVKKGDGKHVDHKKPIRSGGTNARSNLRVQSEAENSPWNKKGRK
jgi:hypothetical protein